MPNSYVQICLHIVFTTYQRQPCLTAPLRARLFPYLGGIVRRLGSTNIRIGGVEDHVHLLVALRPDTSVADLVHHLKGSSSHWLNHSFDLPIAFRWQTGYSAFSVSASLLPAVARYIERQEEHHRKWGFEDEMRELLARHEVALQGLGSLGQEALNLLNEELSSVESAQPGGSAT